MDELKGRIERITYSNEENGYTVARIAVKNRRDLVTVVGALPSPQPGQELHLKGEWTNHPRFGEQFQAKHCTTSAPATATGIRKFLASGLIKGVGPVMAGRIVDTFGEDTLRILDEEPERLAEVEGIGHKRVEMISRGWREHQEIREVMLFLQGHGVSTTYATKIFKTYGREAIRIVQDNPYRLATDIWGIGFLTADRIAAKFGFEKDSPPRVRAGALHVLDELAEEGHVHYPRLDLVQRCQEMLEVGQELVEQGLSELQWERRIVVEPLADFGGEGEAVSLRQLHRSETGVAEKLAEMLLAPKSIRRVDTDKALEWVQRTYCLQLTDRQADAVRRSLTDKVLVITGGPGTGKSFLLSAILRVMGRLRASIQLAAPTGRAAKRMTELTGWEAKTIHRLLEFDPGQGGFKKDAAHPLSCDLLVVDETSMVDTRLMYHLLQALKLDTTLVLVGDENQLPSVGPGNVLKDIIGSGTVPVVELTEIFRQARESSIVVGAHLVNQGQLPELTPRKDKLDDFFFVREDDPRNAVERIKHLVVERIPKRFRLDPISEVQVLAPMNKGAAGVANLNHELQQALNPEGREVSRGGRIFRSGDKVMQLRNNYHKEVFNGDIGRVVSLDSETQEVKIRFEDKDAVYEQSELDELVPAYCVSIHKSQGSDFPAVVLPLLTQHYVMLQRNLIYTAITRGKQLVVLVGSSKALSIAVKNRGSHRRRTLLSERLKAEIAGRGAPMGT